MTQSTAPAVPDAALLARYRRTADYLAAAMIFLRDNTLLREPLRPEHLKPRLLGHWGTCPGITYVYAGLNRLVRRTGQRTLLVTGPGHGAPAIHANLWLEGTHGDVDPRLGRDGAGLAELVRRFSWPGGFPSHLSPEVPGVIHEGGELGYALATAAGAALDDPDLLVACVVGDGEAETGPTAGSWHVTKFLDPATSGTVLPILHLNGYKIASPTIYATMSDGELTDYFAGAGWSPRLLDVTAVDDPDAALAEALDAARTDAADLRERCLAGDRPDRPVWPMLVVRSPKGWGVPDTDAHGEPLGGTFHAHQVPLEDAADDPDTLALLERWLRSYRPDELFDDNGRPDPGLLSVPPEGGRRLGSVPQANGGLLRRDLPLPPVAPAAVEVGGPGETFASPTGALAGWLTELFRATAGTRDFRIMCPDELASNKLDAVLAATGRAYQWPVHEYAEHLATDGRVMEVLSEHLCQGWLQGYLLTGRHGLFPCYEAFVSIVDGMVNQYAKFLKISREVPWRAPVAALNYLLTSDGWRQEHNGYSHQGPGFINNLLTKKASVARIFLPPDANTLLVTMRRCLTSTAVINLVVAGKQDGPQWFDIDTAEAHCRAGAGVLDWASTSDSPQVVIACAGTTPTTEAVAAAWLLRRHAPELRVRVVNVVDLIGLAPRDRHPRGMTEDDFTGLFGADVPVVFAFHGYPSAVHEVLHGRTDPNRFHVHGYLEEGTTTTPYDLLAANAMTRHDLAAHAVSLADGWSSRGGDIVDDLSRERDQWVAHAYRTGADPSAFTDWRWTS
ncbi:phosphoketolase family protein [Asanoa sp. WMMD1127]|uniref:phosphoketolase family protein n=1 Tax=Asanoa sp. WMMD1127 TaxID=3016107 RepID=UPI002417E665|nr:phosphoketolase family protein [Asanoa sp. WMMD1127]MDG4825667.1 phosphoketolase family protein [Asanoa sp. WMMD1127]